MKTSTKIIIAIVIVLLITILGITFTMVTVFNMANQTKDKITAEEFYNKMQAKEYVLTDATQQYYEYDYVKKVYIASKSDFSYQIEFYELSDDSFGKQFFNINKSIIEASKGATNAENSFNFKNGAKYTLKTNGKYGVISRIDNTAIFVNENDEYEEDIKKVLKELGY